MAKDDKTVKDDKTAAHGSATVTAVVLVDTYAWHEKTNDPTSTRHDAPPFDEDSPNPSAKGVEIEVPKAEFERAQKMRPPALAKAKSDEAKAALSDEPQPQHPATTPAGEPVDVDG